MHWGTDWLLISDRRSLRCAPNEFALVSLSAERPRHAPAAGRPWRVPLFSALTSECQLSNRAVVVTKADQRSAASSLRGFSFQQLNS